MLFIDPQRRFLTSRVSPPTAFCRKRLVNARGIRSWSVGEDSLWDRALSDSFTMDASALDAEQAAIELDILKLQLHSVSLNLSLEDEQVVEEDEDDEEDVEDPYLLNVFEDPDIPSTSGVNVGASTSGLGQSQEIVRSQDAYLEEDEPPTEGEEEGELIDLSVDLEPNPQNVLKLNIAYQEVIQQQLHLVDELLEQNKMRTEELNMEMQNEQHNDNGKTRTPKADLGLCLTPFFRHNTFFGGGDVAISTDIPPHVDVNRRYHELGDHFIECPMQSSKWKKHEEKKLTQAVQRVALRRVLEPLMSRLEYLEEKHEATNDEAIETKITEVRAQIEAAKTTESSVLFGNREDKHDWMAISNVDLEGNRTATECALYWQNWLHPSINKKAWTQQEDANLKHIVRKSHEKNWKEVAAELGTGRTPMQCIQRYQSTNMDHRAKPWTPEEDERLRELVMKYGAGSTIPHTLVALKMGTRNANQVCHRWSKSIDPTYKRVKWTPEEDMQLLKAIIKYGLRWSLIRDSGMVPHRNDAQCRERWDNTLRGVSRDPFTKEEDKIIERQVKAVGECSWSSIALALDRRTDNQVLNRWRLIKKCREKGIPIRYRKKGPKTIIDGLSEVRQKLIDTIEQRLKDKKEGIVREKPDLAEITTLKTHPVITPSQPGGSLASSQTIRIPSAMESNRRLKWIGTDLQKSLKNAKDPEEVMVVYKSICEKVASFHAPRDENAWFRIDKIINDKIQKATSDIYKPFKYLGLKEGSNIQVIHRKVLETAKSITPRVIFVNYVKAMNINAEKTLLAIKKSDSLTTPKRGGKRKRSTSKSQEDQEPEPEPNAPKNSTPFVRSHMLQLSAPNRATVSAYKKLMQDRERRVKNAKLMLLERDEVRQKKKVKKANIRPGDSATDEAAASYQGEKYQAEELVKNFQALPEHKMLRARFVSLFAWPTILSSLVPFERLGKFRALKAAVRVKRKALRDDKGGNPDNETVPKKKFKSESQE